MPRDLNSEPVVFIVDDDRAVQDSLRVAFDMLQLPTRVYSTAQQFLDDFRPSQRGCLIADMRLPGMSGLEVVDALRAAGAALPAILITGHGDNEMQAQAERAGVRAVFQKPFRFEELAACVEAELRGGDGPGEAQIGGA